MIRARLIGAVIVALAVLATACGSSRTAPPLVLPTNSAPSSIYDAQGRLITTLQLENRTSVTLDQIPTTVQNAVIAVEDERFWTHHGVDPQAIARAADANVESGESSEGGSTITQQYVKTALLSNEQSLSRKLEEASLAISIEQNYSKQLILELYLNTVYFGNGAYGIDAASHAYFGVAPKDLSVAQAAMLAGVINAPSRFDPRKNPDAAVKRRNLVLRRMHDQGYITYEQRSAATDTAVELAPPAPPPETVPYPAAHFVDAVKEWLLKDSEALGKTQAERFNNLVGGGLRITTTIDLDTQALAEQSVKAILKDQGVDPKTPDAALVSVDPTTGYVRAMVGGYDYFGTHDYRQTNLALVGDRQVGSAFKPIVLATALTNGVPVAKSYPAPSSDVHTGPWGTWRVRGGGIGSGNLDTCTVASSNTCYANIILDPQVTPERSVEMAQKLGIRNTKLAPNPSVVLGSNLATVQDMASVYATFANNGVYVPPVYVTKIERSDGTVLYEEKHTQEKVLEPEVANTISTILPGVIASGTGTAANIARTAAGKTGTTNRNVDAWFCGYTRQLATAVWVGFRPRLGSDGRRVSVAMNPPNTRIVVNGGTYPAQIWATFMKQAMANLPDMALFDPASVPPPTTTAPASDAATLSPKKAPSMATMPDLGGMRTDLALAAVTAAGLRPSRVDVASGAAAGLVSSQSPPSGVKMPSGSTVYVESTPGSYVPPNAIPDLRGFGAGQAASELSAQGFTVTSESGVPPPGSVSRDGTPIVAGQVWKTTPTAGQTAPDGRITITWMPQSAAPTTPGAPGG